MPQRELPARLSRMFLRGLLSTVLLSLPLAAVAAPTVSKPAPIVRDWKSATGREMKAELLEFDTKEIRIKRTADLAIVKVPLTALGEEDKAYIQGLLHERMLDTSLTEGPYAKRITGSFVKATSNQGLNYQIYGNPQWDNKQRYPLVIWLHGSGQSGSDNEAQMGGATGVFTSSTNQTERPCFMIAPQCPSADIGWNKAVADQLMALIADLASKLPIDMKRLYLTGSSMGGFGSFSLAVKYPQVFAAVVPLCGGSDVKNAAVLKAVPIWAFHGDKDDMVPVERTRNVMNAITAAGGELAKYDELVGAGHGITGMVYSKPELHQWMFSQVRKQ